MTFQLLHILSVDWRRILFKLGGCWHQVFSRGVSWSQIKYTTLLMWLANILYLLLYYAAMCDNTSATRIWAIGKHELFFCNFDTVSTVQLHFCWLFSYLLTICLHLMLKFCFSSFFLLFLRTRKNWVKLLLYIGTLQTELRSNSTPWNKENIQGYIFKKIGFQ